MTTAQQLIDQFSDIQTLPHVVTHLSKLMADNNTTMKQFEDVIKMDPILVARLLKLVNSPFYGLMQKVDSISRAVAYIGMKNLHNIAVTEALKSIFIDGGSQNQAFSRNNLWLHCAAVSICSKMVAERIFGINGDDAYLTGILHDFGTIVEEQVMPAEFLQVSNNCTSSSQLLEAERTYLGTDHSEIGYLLTTDWGMPKELCNAIRDHHELEQDYEPGSLTGILQIAEYITAQHGYSAIEGLESKIAPSLLAHIQENIEEYQVLMEDFPEEMANAKDLYSSGGK